MALSTLTLRPFRLIQSQLVFVRAFSDVASICLVRAANKSAHYLCIVYGYGGVRSKLLGIVVLFLFCMGLVSAFLFPKINYILPAATNRWGFFVSDFSLLGASNQVCSTRKPCPPNNDLLFDLVWSLLVFVCFFLPIIVRLALRSNQFVIGVWCVRVFIFYWFYFCLLSPAFTRARTHTHSHTLVIERSHSSGGFSLAEVASLHTQRVC